jgi:hypothetical protein
MVTVVQDNRESPWAALVKGLATGAGKGFADKMRGEHEHKQNIELEREKMRLKEKEEDVGRFKTGLETINQMREIAGKKNIGRGSGVWGTLFGGETAEDSAEFAQLGKSLIPLVAAGVPIRNQREFDEYKKVITDPSSQLSAIEGALNGIQKIFEEKVGGPGEGKSGTKPSKLGRVKPGTPLDEETAERLYKKSGRDREKMKKVAKKLGYAVE